MKKVHWIRFDIPYQKDGVWMRAIAAWGAADALEYFITDYCKDIPAALGLLQSHFEEKELIADEETIAVYPLDGRMNLAWVVKEIADEKGWDFSRQIPQTYYPGVKLVRSFETLKTGSADDDLDARSIQQKVFDLNNEAREEYINSDLPNAMSLLREALQLTTKHFGWTSPGTVYCLINFSHTMSATGNGDNIREVTAAIERLLFIWTLDKPTADEWNGSLDLISQLAECCVNMGRTDLQEALLNYQPVLSA